jgi:tol-pal system protein YbgF
MRTRGRGRIQPVLFLAALPLAACGTVATGSDLDSVRGEVNGLRRQLLEVKATSDGNRQFLEQRIARLEEEGPRSRTDLATRLQEMSTELRLVQGKLEENAHVVSEGNRRMDDVGQRLASLNTRLLAMEGQVRALQQAVRAQQGGPPAAAAPAAPQAPPPPPITGQVPGDRLPPFPPFPGQQPAAPPSGAGAAPPTIPPSPFPPGPAVATAPHPPPPPVAVDPRFAGQPADVIYSTALTDYTKRDYDQAIRGFQAFIVQHPRDSRVADAQWWLADTYYSMENYPQAIKEYDVVIRNFPDSPRAPAAMFKQGLAYLQSNDPTGCRILRDMMVKYPRTREAGRAREELRQPICR